MEPQTPAQNPADITGKSDDDRAAELDEQIKSLTDQAHQKLGAKHMLVAPGATLDSALRGIGELELADSLKSKQTEAEELHKKRFGGIAGL